MISYEGKKKIVYIYFVRFYCSKISNYKRKQLTLKHISNL